jgi:hypothetical protein
MAAKCWENGWIVWQKSTISTLFHKIYNPHLEPGCVNVTFPHVRFAFKSLFIVGILSYDDMHNMKSLTVLNTIQHPTCSIFDKKSHGQWHYIYSSFPSPSPPPTAFNFLDVHLLKTSVSKQAVEKLNNDRQDHGNTV